MPTDKTMTRRNFVQRTAAAAGLLCCGLSLSGCMPDNMKKDGKSRVTIVFDPTHEPESGFDPLYAWGTGVRPHDPLIQSTLFKYNEEDGFTNDLATSIDVSEDGLTYEIGIRDDAVFSDGSALAASDVAFTLNGVHESDSSCVDLSSVDSVEATDDYIVTVHMTSPDSALPYALQYIGIVPEASYDEISYGTNPLGSGPFKLQTWERGQRIELVSNPMYYGDKPSITTVCITFDDDDAACNACYEGTADLVYTTPRLSDQSINGYSLLDCVSMEQCGITLPLSSVSTSNAVLLNTQPADPSSPNSTEGTSRPIGNDVTCNLAIRKALNYGLNRKKLIETALKGYGTSAYCLATGLPWGDDKIKIKTDTTEAVRLLEADGWLLGTDDIRVRNGQRASIDLYYHHSDNEVSNKQTLNKNIADEFVRQMKNIGIEILPHATGFEQIETVALSQPTLRTYGSGSPAEIDEVYRSNAYNNLTGYASSQTDAYIDAARASADLDEANAQWKKAQWDGTNGPVAQGNAAQVWLATIDDLYFKRSALNVGRQHVHTRGGGWSLLNSIAAWTWDTI
ncbi:MAG: ABC transporter substrate-binding protein [Eggerthellaceae bacterium]|nr:ABC transporter substrate-binding protein [Eggerthellaceae bacterium]